MMLMMSSGEHLCTIFIHPRVPIAVQLQSLLPAVITSVYSPSHVLFHRLLVKDSDSLDAGCGLLQPRPSHIISNAFRLGLATTMGPCARPMTVSCAWYPGYESRQTDVGADKWLGFDVRPVGPAPAAPRGTVWENTVQFGTATQPSVTELAPRAHLVYMSLAAFDQ
jgi:hypothetical protein